MRVRLFAIALLVALVAPAVGTAADPKEKKYDSAANLYLMRNLEHTLSTWKPPTASPSELGVWMAVTRKRLGVCKDAAKSYGASSEVVDAYDDALTLLDKYEQFLKDVVYFDLITNAARPVQKDFNSSLAEGATQTGVGTVTGLVAGAGVGTMIFPVIGTVTGAAVGGVAAGVGGVASLVSYAMKRGEEIEREKQLNDVVKRAKLDLIKGLTTRAESVADGVKNKAKILAGDKKWGWGDEVGFDGSDKLSLAKQLALRPNDPFLRVAVGVDLARAGDYAQASEAFAKAAALIPPDDDDGVDIFDKDRAEYLFAAARMAEAAARTSPSGVKKRLAELSAKYFTQAQGCLKNGEKLTPREFRLTHARALALAGDKSSAEDEMATLLKAFPNDPRVLYEYAGVLAECGDAKAGLQKLVASYNARPRWDPAAVTDPRLSALRANYAADVERVTTTAGTWKAANFTITLNPDGTSQFTSSEKSNSGTYEIGGGKLTLYHTKTTTFDCTLYRTDMKLVSKGVTYNLSRPPLALVGVWEHSDGTFELDGDGKWRIVSGGKTTRSGWYSVLQPWKDESGELIRWNSDPLVGGFESRGSYSVKDGALTYTPAGSSSGLTYQKRK